MSGLVWLRGVRFAALCVAVGPALSCARSSSIPSHKPDASTSAGPVASAAIGTSDLIAVRAAHGAVGFIDRQGHVVVSPQFEPVRPASEGLLVARQHGLWGFLDPRGKWAIPATFAEAQSFSEGRAAAALPGVPERVFGFIDHSGHWAIKPRFRSAAAFHGGLARVTENAVTQYVDAAGGLAFKAPGEASYDFREGFARFVSHGKMGFLNASGQLSIAARFDDALDFSDGLAAVKERKLWGFIDHVGAYRIRPRFVDASFFACGIAKVALSESRSAFVDLRGKLLGSFEATADCSNGYAAIMRANRWGFIDPKGAVVVEPKFEKFEAGFAEGLVAVAETGGRFGYVGANGQYAIEPRFSSAQAFEGGLARVEQASQDAGAPEFGYIDHHGAFVWGPFPAVP